MKQAMTFLATLVLLSANSWSHDYWIAPKTYRPQAGEPFDVRLLVGDHFKGDTERPLQKKMTVTFQLFQGKAKPRDLMDAEQFEKKPIAKLTLKGKGDYLLAMERDWSTIEMKGPKFHQYLEHEGLSHIIKEREKAGEADASATERYRRYLKSLVVVGESNGTWKRQLGHKLEIMPLSDPSRAKAGSQLSFRVLLDGKPLAGVQLAAMGRDGTKITDQHSRTNNSGEATFKINHSGEWVVRLVHLRRCTESKEVDWESFWSALTFHIN